MAIAREQIGFLGRGQLEWKNLFVELRVGDPAFVVMFDDVFERRQAPVVHVGCVAGHFAERWSLEGPFVAFDLGHLIPAKVRLVGFHTDANVMKSLVGEIRPAVAS